MKKLLMIGSIVLVLGLLIIGSTTTIFAHGPDDGGVMPADEEAWEAMHEACEDGDWEAMVEAAEEVHGEDWNGTGGMMGNGWNGMGGMMGW